MRRCIPILACLFLFGVAAAHAHPDGRTSRVHHRRGCHTWTCDRHIDRVWARRIARQRLLHDERATSFDLCVANQENGEPGSTAWAFINWRADNDYEGAFSWEHSKWVAGGGLRFAAHPYEASPGEQIAVFHQNGRNGEWTLNNWPTIARCR